jgi:hypothetical protein
VLSRLHAHLAGTWPGPPGAARRPRGAAGAGRDPGAIPWQLSQHRCRAGHAACGGGRRRERVPAGRVPGRGVGGGLVRLLPDPPLREVHHHPAGRHRDHHPAAGHRRGGHRDRGVGTASARGREPAGGLSRRVQCRRPGRRHRGQPVRAYRSGGQPAHPGAGAEVVPVPARRCRARPAGPDGARRVGHRRAPGLGCGCRRPPPGHRHRTPGGKRRRVPGPVPDDAHARCPAHAGATAAGRRACRPGRCRTRHEPSRRPGITRQAGLGQSSPGRGGPRRTPTSSARARRSAGSA